MFTKLFWKDAAERVLSTFAQVVVALVTFLAPANDMNLLAIDYMPIIAVGIIAAVLSLLKAIGAAYKAGTDTASLVVDTKELK